MAAIDTRNGDDNNAPGTPQSQVQKINEMKITTGLSVNQCPSKTGVMKSAPTRALCGALVLLTYSICPLRRVMVRPTKPATEVTAPPMSIQTALSVGDPVKNLETSELKEFVACNPRMVSTTPPTSRAMYTILFITAFLDQEFVGIGP
jgi:hypothetical protein